MTAHGPRGLQPQSHPKAEEHRQAYQPATQLRAPLRPVPYYSTRHTETRRPVKVIIIMNKPPKQRKKNQGGEETLDQESSGRERNQEKKYATRTPRHANKARRHMACACAEATYRWTGICPMLTNNDESCKRKHVTQQHYRRPTCHQSVTKH